MATIFQARPFDAILLGTIEPQPSQGFRDCVIFAWHFTYGIEVLAASGRLPGAGEKKLIELSCQGWKSTAAWQL
jgi:hypothetical protein